MANDIHSKKQNEMQNVIWSLMESTCLVLRQRNLELCDEPRKRTAL